MAGCPLTLTPSETVVKFGDPVSINCSTSARYVEGMGWEAPFGGTGFERPPVVTWRVEKLEEWTPSPSCYATLVDGSQCAVSPVITVYKTPETVSISEMNHGLMLKHKEDKKYTKTQYKLQCDIINVAPVQYLTITWYKNNKIIKTESFNDTTKTPVNESSILRVNISKEEKVIELRCEAKLDFGPRGPKLPAISQTHNVSAHLSNMSEYEGNPVTVNCTTALAEHKGLYFTVGNETSRIIEEQMSISQSVSLSDWNVTIKCKVKLNESHECSKDLQVITFKNPEVFHSVQLVNVTRKETQYRLQCDIINVAPVQYVTVSWYKNSEKIQTESFNDTTTKTPVNKSSILRVNISREENVVEFRCEAQLDFGPHRPKLPAISQTHRVSAHCCPLTLTPSETVVKFGDPVSINCSTSVRYVQGMGWEAPFGGTGFERAPVVTWRVEKLEEWTPSPFCYVTLVNGSQCTVSPVITVYKTPDSVSVSDMGHGSMVEGREYDLKCDVINVAPVQNLTVTWYRGNETVLTQMFNDSTMTPVNVSSTLRISTLRDYNGLTFRCEAELHLRPKGPKHSSPDGNPFPTVQWFYEGKILNSSKPLTRTDSGKYTAIVQNSHGRSNTSVHITVEYSPSFTCKEHYEITVNDKHQSICEPVGLPTPTLTWFKDGKQMVSPQLWKKNDSGKYLLNAHNTHGTSFYDFSTVKINAPEFKEGNESKEVLQGENVTLSCSADSNPPSNITWIYTAAVNSNMTTEGRQKTVTITRATSTNAGYYICVAENKVGRNTRFITLMITGMIIDSVSQIPFPIIWVSLTLLIIILILLVVCCRICQKKRGHYSFFPVKVSNVSNIPLTSVQANGKAKDF
uniref:Ig-like domain-containing protein n=1 Tax=Pundamilia nyererei TaxID=303518 RepID=A0A3B4G6C9_9CICH